MRTIIQGWTAIRAMSIEVNDLGLFSIHSGLRIKRADKFDSSCHSNMDLIR